MKVKILPLLVLALTMAVSACKKDDDNEPSIPVEPTCRLTSIINEDGETKIQYDANNRIIRMDEFSSDGTPIGYQTISYNATGSVEKIEYYINTTNEIYHFATFEYNSQGKVVKQTEYNRHFPGFGQPAGYNTYEYNGFGEMIKISSFSNSNSTPGSTATLEYSNGNVTRLEEVRPNVADASYGLAEFEYDNKKNPYHNIGLPATFHTTISKNNILKETGNAMTIAGPVDYTTNYTYDYNANGFPTKATRITTNTYHSGAPIIGSPSIETYEYKCE